MQTQIVDARLKLLVPSSPCARRRLSGHWIARLPISRLRRRLSSARLHLLHALKRNRRPMRLRTRPFRRTPSAAAAAALQTCRLGLRLLEMRRWCSSLRLWTRVLRSPCGCRGTLGLHLIERACAWDTRGGISRFDPTQSHGSTRRIYRCLGRRRRSSTRSCCRGRSCAAQAINTRWIRYLDPVSILRRRSLPHTRRSRRSTQRRWIKVLKLRRLRPRRPLTTLTRLPHDRNGEQRPRLLLIIALMRRFRPTGRIGRHNILRRRPSPLRDPSRL